MLARLVLDVNFQGLFSNICEADEVFLVSQTLRWQVWYLHFGSLWTILAPWGHLGEPWEQQAGLLGGLFYRFAVDFGPHVGSF